MNRITCFSLTMAMCATILAQETPDVIKFKEHGSIERREIIIPNIPGYVSLKCDLHAHTIFSDGDVHPVFRINEAWADGLDAIAITDHLEYLKYKEYIKGTRDDSYTLAKPRADKLGLMLIKGCEITRQKPFGHMNALFITNAQDIYDSIPERSVEKAIAQNSFIMWNHPGWPDDKSTMTEMHRNYLKNKTIRGIELFNFNEYYPPALKWCKENKASYIAASDVHGSTFLDYHGDIRPMTLVFAKEKNLDGIKEALMEGRTIAWFNGLLAGNKELLNNLFHACITTKTVKGKIKKMQYRELQNQSSIQITISNGDQKVTIAPKATVIVHFNEGTSWKVENFWEVYNQPIDITF